MSFKSRTVQQDLLSIGIVAKSFGVNPNTIRRIEAAGLLRPSYISESSSYRYYDSSNLLLLAEILSLREYGFIYDDLKTYYETPGDYSSLYQRLLQQREVLDMQIERIERYLPPEDSMECKIIQYSDANCICRKIGIVPNISHLFDEAKQFLFEVVKMGARIDFTRSYMILSDCMDYRSLDLDTLTELTFCIPVLNRISEWNNYLHIPASKALSCTWTDSDEAGWKNRIMEKFDQLFKEEDLQQSDTCRIAFRTYGHLGNDRQGVNRVIHFMVPIKGK